MQDYDLALSRTITTFTHTMRKEIYDRVKDPLGSGLIIDVGAGSGQAMSELNHQSISFLFCDPSLDITRWRKRRNTIDISSMPLQGKI